MDMENTIKNTAQTGKAMASPNHVSVCERERETDRYGYVKVY